MKKLNSAVDRFCYRHPRFGIPNLMLYIVMANVIVWVFSLMDTTGTLTAVLSFAPRSILRGQVWRLVSFAFVLFTGTGLQSFGDIVFPLITFYFYYFIGSNIERQWGSGKFTIYLLSGMLLTVIYGFILYFAMGAGLDEDGKKSVSLLVSSGVSAYYIYLSMFFTFATLYPDTQVLMFFLIPMKMKWLAWVDAALFAFDVIRTPFPFDLLPVVAILNYLLFCGDELLAYFKPASRKQRQNTVNFRSEVRRMQYEQRTRPYTRRCEVCGRTDTDFPDLEFRYCSRCAGYHCFCIDHINNHRHFTE